MRKAHNLRATIMHAALKESDCQMVANEAIGLFLKSIPSYTEVKTCKACEIRISQIFPLLLADNVVFDGRLVNLEAAITSNFPEFIPCSKCGQKMNVIRTPSEHLFIDVSEFWVVEYYIYFIISI